MFIRIPRPGRSQPGLRSTTVWTDLRAGLRYLRSWPGMLALLGIAAAINLCLVPAFSLLPLLVLEEWGGDAMRLGWMTSVFGVGAIAGGILLGVWGGFDKRIVTALAALVVLGLAVTALGLAPASPAWLAFAAMLVVGLSAPLVNGPIQTVVQITVAPDYQGRVFTLMGSVAGAMAPLGLLVAGPLATATDVRTWYVAGGLFCAMLGIVAFFVPAILEVETRRPEPAAATGTTCPT
jgi:DHA3 family macrolide efflux protein-like MFS transporter